MRTWMRVCVAVAALGSVVAVASAQAARGPVVAWSPTTSTGAYDFGTFDLGAGQTPKPVTFTLRNSGRSATGALTVTMANTSGSAFSITRDRCSGLSLGPRKSCRVTVAFAPGGSGESDGATLSAHGERARANARLSLSGKTGAPSLGWSRSGTAISSYDFGAVDGVGGNTASQTFTLKNSGSGTTDSLTASLTNTSSTAFSITSNGCSAIALAPGETCSVTVQYAPTSSGESDSGTLTAGGVDLNLTGSGGTPSLAWSQGATTITSYDYGTVTAGNTATKTFTLTNSGTGSTGSLTASLANSTGTAFSIPTGDDGCTGVSLAPGHSCTITVQFAPTAGGESDSGSLSAGGASLALTGSGGGPSLAWSPTTSIDTYAYGTVPAGNIASQKFTLTNSGTGSTGSLTASVSGTGFSIGTAIGDDTCTGSTLAPGQSCTVTVKFAPTSNGESDSGTLSAGGQDLTFTGSGSLQNLVLTQTGSGTFTQSANNADGSKTYENDFGSQFEPATATFTVTNGGPGTSEPLNSLTVVQSQFDGGFAIGNDHCSGTSLASGGSCTFDATFTVPCMDGTERFGAISVSGTEVTYIKLELAGICSL